MPHATGKLRELLAQSRRLGRGRDGGVRFGPDLQITIQDRIVVDVFRINTSKDDVDDRETILAIVSALALSSREFVRTKTILYLAFPPVVHRPSSDEGLGSTEGVTQHKVLEAGIDGEWVAGYQRLVPSNRKRRRAEGSDKIPQRLKSR